MRKKTFELPLKKSNTTLDRLIEVHGNDTYLLGGIFAQMEYMTDMMNKYGGPEDIAKKLNVTSHTVRMWYHGIRRLPIYKAKQLEMICNERKMHFWKYLKAHW